MLPFKTRKGLKRYFLIAAISLLVVLVGCKEPTIKSSPKKKAQTRDIAQVSANIERLTADALERPVTAADNAQTPNADEKVIDIEAISDETTETLVPLSTERVPFSEFYSAFEPQVIRVTISTRGVPRNQIESVDNRMMTLLNTHAPQPFDLRKASSIDRYDSVWGNLHIDYSRQSVRLRRASKTSPLRALYKFAFEMHLKTNDSSRTISWNDWVYKWQDENTVSNESAVNAHFWKRIEGVLPLLTSIQTEETEQWLRAQGLNPKILSGDLSAMKVFSHQYYANGCVVELPESPQASALLRHLASPYSPPRQLSVVPITMYCQGKSTFVVSAESANRVALYYHPDDSAHAWKSSITFQSGVKKGDLGMYADDDVICLYTGNDPAGSRTVECQCLDRKSGIMLWRLSPMSGALRGFAATDEAIYLAADHQIISIQKDGTQSQVQRLVTSGRQKKYLSCAFEDELIFSTSAGHLVAYRFDGHDIDWETTVLEPSMIHCSQHHLLLVFETGGYLLAFDTLAHKPLWKYRTVTTPKDVMTYGGIIYILLDRAILALDPENGEVKAQIPLAWPVDRFILSGGRLYLDAPDDILTWK